MDYIERSLDLAREYEECYMYDSKFHPADECRSLNDLIYELYDVENIWHQAVVGLARCGSDCPVCLMFERLFDEKYIELARSAGVEGMLAAYYAGVPVEDIVA